jgi:protein transport protein SEC24
MAPPQMAQPAQAPRPRGIDPDAVPSPVAVEAADIDKYSKQTYSTGSKLVPPLPNTPAKILDDGNCSPRIMRSSMYDVPHPRARLHGRTTLCRIAKLCSS